MFPPLANAILNSRFSQAAGFVLAGLSARNDEKFGVEEIYLSELITSGPYAGQEQAGCPKQMHTLMVLMSNESYRCFSSFGNKSALSSAILTLRSERRRKPNGRQIQRFADM